MSEHQPSSQPGSQVQRLGVFAGEWDAFCTMWPQPGQPPMEYQGVMRNSWELGNRFLKQSFTASMFGRPFEGTGYWGHNASTGLFEGVWMDTASAMMQHETGTVDATGTVFTMRGSLNGPDGQTIQKRSVITVRSPDEHAYEMYFAFGSGGEFKILEARYTRRKH